MKIGIIGYGFVGGAVRSILKNEYSVRILDPFNEFIELDYRVESLKELQDFEPEIIFICVPTPTVDGSCDDNLVLDYVRNLTEYNGILVVKSTIPLHTVEEIEKIRPRTVVWPELLREKYAHLDMKHPRIMVVGTLNDEDFNTLERFVMEHTTIEWRDLDFLSFNEHDELPSLMRKVSPKEASIFKYAINSFLATKVLFMHQMFLWLERRGDGALWENISALLGDEGRIGETHLQAPGDHGLGYAGTCFPKDVKALLEQVYHKDLTTFPLLNEVDYQNERLRKTIL